MNFFFRFHITLKNGFEFRFVWLVIWKTDLNFVCHLKSPDTPSGLTGEFTFYAKESNWIWPLGQSEWWTPPPTWYVPHTRYSFFNKGWQIIDDSGEKNKLISEQLSQHLYTLDGKGKWRIFEDFTTWSHKMRDKKNYKSSFTVFWSFCRMTQLLQVSFLSSFPRYNYIISTITRL